jgi:putative FmdB family regulatory protein
MPIYEYTCPRCGGMFEALRGMEERHSCPCPKCHVLSDLVPSLCNWWFANPFTKDGIGFTSEIAHPDKLKELQQENRRHGNSDLSSLWRAEAI